MVDTKTSMVFAHVCKRNKHSTSQARPSNNTRHVDVEADELQMDQQDGRVSTDNRERSGSMQIEQPRPVELQQNDLKRDPNAPTLEWLMTS